MQATALGLRLRPRAIKLSVGRTRWVAVTYLAEALQATLLEHLQSKEARKQQVRQQWQVRVLVLSLLYTGAGGDRHPYTA